MKKSSNRRRRPGGRRKPNRVEQLTASIRNHLTALDRATTELTEEASKAAYRGCTPEETDEIDLAYVTTPLQMLLITAKVIIDSLPEDSGIDRNRAIEILERHAGARAPTCEIASDLLDLIRECIDYIRDELSGPLAEDAQRPPTLH